MYAKDTFFVGNRRRVLIKLPKGLRSKNDDFINSLSYLDVSMHKTTANNRNCRSFVHIKQSLCFNQKKTPKSLIFGILYFLQANTTLFLEATARLRSYCKL